MAVTAQHFHFGEFTLDQSRYRLERGDRVVRLEKRPMELLMLLLERQGELVSRDEIARRLWDKDVFVDVEHGINTAVRKVRLALRDDPEKPRFVETIFGKGYRFAAHVTCSNNGATGLAVAIEPKAEELKVSPALTDVPSATRTGTPKTSQHRNSLVVLGAALLIALAAGVLFLSRHWNVNSVSRPAIKSIAVLPLKNLSADPSQDYLADGLTEDLIGRLAAIHNLRVVSHTSVMRFKDTKLSVPEIARTLGVDAVVEGSMIREGNRIRVHAQLIRAATDEHFWSESYDRELQDVLNLQSEVAQSIAAKVEVTISGKEHERLTAAHPIAPEVYESYLKGESVLNNTYTRAGLQQSIAFFDAAIASDATFAPAYVGLAEAYDGMATVFIGASPSELRPKVVSAASKALELDPGITRAHVLLADTYQEQWRWSDAEAEYKKALELNPNDAIANLGMARWLLCQGRTNEAITWAKRGRELDPFVVTGSAVGQILFYSHRYDEAIQELSSDLAVRQNSASGFWYLGFVLLAKDEPQEAVRALEKAVALSHGGPGVLGVLIRAYAQAGRRRDALRLLAELKRRQQDGYVPAGAFVNAYLGIGDQEQAFVWLEKAYQEQSNILQFVKVHPYFDPIRNDPRFADLVHRVGLK